MNRIITLFVVACLALLGGCASSEQYAAYVLGEKARAEAKAASDIARYQALALVGASGDEAAKVAAVISIAGGGAQPQQSGPGLAPPRSGADTALQWASILVPGLTQAYSINRNTALAARQSDNALAATQSTNQTMLGFGQLINSPVVVTQPDPVIVTQPAPVIVNPVVVQPEVVQPTVIQIPAAP